MERDDYQFGFRNNPAALSNTWFGLDFIDDFRQISTLDKGLDILDVGAPTIRIAKGFWLLILGISIASRLIISGRRAIQYSGVQTTWSRVHSILLLVAHNFLFIR